MLLVGYAIENYAKAISVIHHPRVTENGKLKRLKRHDLLGLISEINFSLSSDEKELLERLEQFVLWAGRYPIPTDAKTVSPTKRRMATNDWLIYSLSADSTVSSQLLDRLEKQVECEIEGSLRHGT
ncbi:MAG: hypothetical protein HZB59_08290 [Ignavibacteriales bacterium]|nr:hypothetical protein [Ignavibacteriales bacterium]